jgi:hypothetical protein
MNPLQEMRNAATWARLSLAALVLGMPDTLPAATYNVPNPASLSLTSMVGGARMTYRGATNFRFLVQSSTDWTSWSLVASNVATNRTMAVRDNSAGSFPERYYRAVTLKTSLFYQGTFSGGEAGNFVLFARTNNQVTFLGVNTTRARAEFLHSADGQHQRHRLRHLYCGRAGLRLVDRDQHGFGKVHQRGVAGGHAHGGTEGELWDLQPVRGLLYGDLFRILPGDGPGVVLSRRHPGDLLRRFEYAADGWTGGGHSRQQPSGLLSRERCRARAGHVRSIHPHVQWNDSRESRMLASHLQPDPERASILTTPRRTVPRMRLSILVICLVPALAPACDLCAIYNASSARGESGSGFLFTLSQQYIPYGTVQREGKELSDYPLISPAFRDFLDSAFNDTSITHFVPSYNFSKRFGVSLNVPWVWRNFRLAEIDPVTAQELVEEGTESGLGDVSLVARWTALRVSKMKYAVHRELPGRREVSHRRHGPARGRSGAGGSVPSILPRARHWRRPPARPHPRHGFLRRRLRRDVESALAALDSERAVPILSAHGGARIRIWGPDHGVGRAGILCALE